MLPRRAGEHHRHIFAKEQQPIGAGVDIVIAIGRTRTHIPNRNRAAGNRSDRVIPPAAAEHRNIVAAGTAEIVIPRPPDQPVVAAGAVKAVVAAAPIDRVIAECTEKLVRACCPGDRSADGGSDDVAVGEA